MAADKATPESVNFMVKYGRGLICVPMTRERLDALSIPMMVQDETAPVTTAFTVTVDARWGVTTGISAHDRAATIRALVDPKARPEDLTRPGHILPLRAMPGGVLQCAGLAEAAVDLARLAGLSPVGVVCEVMDEDGKMARSPQLLQLARTHDLRLINIDDLITYRLAKEKLVRRVATTRLLTQFGEFTAVAYETSLDDRVSLALVMGDVANGSPVLVSIHFGCLIGDVFHSKRCGCGSHLEKALSIIRREGARGAGLYASRERWNRASKQDPRLRAPRPREGCSAG